MTRGIATPQQKRAKDGKPPDVSVETVTPPVAEGWLEENRSNRPLRDDKIDRYATLMQKGDWMLSPDAIAFDYNGALINGQHRLHALVRSGTTQDMLVIWNLHPRAKQISDVGIKRTAADALAMEGYPNPGDLAAACRLVVLWDDGRLENCNRYNNVENLEVVRAAAKCANRMQDSIAFAISHKRDLQKLKMDRSAVVFCHFAYTPTFGRRAEEFLDKLATGVGIEDWSEGGETYKSPVKLLRDRLQKDITSEGSLNRDEKLAYLIKAMNAYCTKEKIKRLRYFKDQGDLFPELEIGSIPEYQ